jgi:Family of unknown function (DUF5677)
MTTQLSLRERALPHLRELLNEAAAIAGRLRFDPNNRQHIISVALLGSILEQAHGILITLEHANGTSAFILLRSALEAHIDLYNIASNADYAETMHAALLDQQRLMIASANRRDSSNPYLASMAGNQTVDQHLAWIRSELASLRSRGIEPLSIKRSLNSQMSLIYMRGLTRCSAGILITISTSSKADIYRLDHKV